MAPFKRMRQPKMTTQALLDFDLGESSSDSDFRIEDHNVSDDDCTSKDDDDRDDSGDESEDSDSDNASDDENASGAESDDSTQQLKQLLASDVEQQTNGGDDLEAMLKQLDSKTEKAPTVPTKPICCVCLGDRSDDSNEIIECDGCGVSVHEGCYGVSDNASISSTNSTCSTEPWFCEACRAGVSETICELCPNKGGIYKETDVGKWVHLVCALYVPGVAFGEVDQLSSVTLFEMQYSKWGAKACSLCENSRFARTGVCIGCDAGMCKTYFHVTCAQATGFLTEAHHEEAEAADPFYAHCKVHSEKEMIKKRKRNFHTFRLNMQQKQKEKLALKLEDPCPAQMRIQRKLLKYQRKYASHKQLKVEPWVPTQKMSRLLTTSASACKRLLAKASIMAVDVELLERQEAQIAALTDIRKKWHISPAFSVEFIGYYLDRISRSKELKQQLGEMMDSNSCLSKEQDMLRKEYDAHLDRNKELKAKQESLQSLITQVHKHISALCPSKNLPSVSNIGRAVAAIELPKISTPPTRPISVPTPAALKMGVGFPLAHLGPPGSKVDSSRLLSTHAKDSPTTTAAAVATSSTASIVAATSTSSAPTTPTLNVQTFDCGICKRFSDQHLLAKCDTCKLYYHLGCLNPPLTRHPKKSKLYGWQCSECDKSDESDAITELPKGPRKSRTRFNKDGCIVPVQDTDKPLAAMAINKEAAGSNKRRSTDTAPPTKPTEAKKSLNKSLPLQQEASVNETQRIAQVAHALAKKSKLSLSYVPLTAVTAQGVKEKSVSPTKLTTLMKKPKSVTGVSTTQPVHANLSTEEPLLLVLPPQNSTPHSTVDAMETLDHDPLALPLHSNNTASSLDEFSDANRQSRKQKRKDKHRNKHNLSSDTEKSPAKEHHKRKRKKKLHVHNAENPSEAGGIIPKIKIKFKTLPLPGEKTPEAQFFYVSADMVRSAEEASRPTSVETVEDAATSVTVTEEIVMKPAVVVLSNTPCPVATAKITPTRKISPRKANRRLSAGKYGGAHTTTQSAQNLICCICRTAGLHANSVTCDVCHKHYHFTCLDPPVRKTPKIRGYSWHCADCDPTDDEGRK